MKGKLELECFYRNGEGLVLTLDGLGMILTWREVWVLQKKSQ